MVGIRDVAKYAGVSPSTVSRALSGVAFVEPETKEKVMKAVSDLNYKPNLAARSLKKGGSRLIGLIIPDIMNPYYPEVVKYMEACATKAGYSLILCDALGLSLIHILRPFRLPGGSAPCSRWLPRIIFLIFPGTNALAAESAQR